MPIKRLYLQDGQSSPSELVGRFDSVLIFRTFREGYERGGLTPERDTVESAHDARFT